MKMMWKCPNHISFMFISYYFHISFILFSHFYICSYCHIIFILCSHYFHIMFICLVIYVYLRGGAFSIKENGGIFSFVEHLGSFQSNWEYCKHWGQFSYWEKPIKGYHNTCRSMYIYTYIYICRYVSIYM